MRRPNRSRKKDPLKGQHKIAHEYIVMHKKWRRAIRRGAPSTWFAKRSSNLTVEEVDILLGRNQK